MKNACLILLMLMVWPVPLLAAQPLFSLSDPVGDDNGGGKMLYPARDDFAPGDLDLVRFSAKAAKGGTWFEARFKNKIRSPQGVISRYSPQKLSSFIHEDFYTINLEIYIDTDALPGSGNRMLLPGRKAETSRDYAWEKAVILTPRPNNAKSLLGDSLIRNAEFEYKARAGRLDQHEKQTIQEEIKDMMAGQFYFPSKIKVHGRDISCFVPDAFLGAKPQKEWRYVVIVTGADPEQPIDYKLPFKERPPLMMLPVRSGRPAEAFGLEPGADPGQAPIIDVLLPTKDMQYALLNDYDPAGGRVVQLTGIGMEGTSSAALKQDSPGNMDAQPETPALTPAPAPPFIPSPSTVNGSGMDALLNPEAATVEKKPDVVERLQNLEQLRNQELVTEEEYQQLRRKILSEL